MDQSWKGSSQEGPFSFWWERREGQRDSKGTLRVWGRVTIVEGLIRRRVGSWAETLV